MVDLVVTASAGTGGRPPYVQLTGTIQQVLDELQNQNVTAKQLLFWTDNATIARAVFCRMK